MSINISKLGYTYIPNEIFKQCQLSISARFLLCILLQYCRKKDTCFPSQSMLARNMGVSSRQVRNLIKELVSNDLPYVKRQGFNRSNTYYVAKSFQIYEKNSSYHLGSKFPLHLHQELPTNSTKGKRLEKISEDNYLKRKKELYDHFSIKK